MTTLILSIFPGIDLLGRAFETEWPEACIVRGPDLLWGGDIKTFHPPADVFDGVIGGPPCQAFSQISAVVRAKGFASRQPNLIPEFERVVAEARPTWFLMENVRLAPVPVVPGYQTHSFLLNNRWLGEPQSRLRKFTFGTPDGRHLQIEIAALEHPVFEYCVTAGHGSLNDLKYDRNGISRPKRTLEACNAASRRPFAHLCELQGLPTDFLAEAPFTKHGKLSALGNGVPIPMGRAIARAICRALAEVSP